MKQAITIENSELSKTVIRAIEEQVEKLVNNLVEGYQDSLRQNGYYIPPSDIEALKKFIRGDMAVKLSLTVSLTEKKLDEWHMSAIKATQSFLEIGTEAESKKDDTKMTFRMPGKESVTVTKQALGDITKSLEDEKFREERRQRAEAQV